ncbi:MAG: ABC transporter permease [Ferruginibacter sp.]|nr:ABC transporter permease [Ferruginibacter sp.]
MIKNFFKVALRNLGKHKGFSFINIAGLSFGLTACQLITLFVWDEHQYDRFLPGSENIVRIYNENRSADGTEQIAVVPPMFGTTLKSDFPEVEHMTRILMQSERKTLFETSGKSIYEDRGFLADSTFFNVFPLTFVKGTPAKAMDDPTSIVISTEMAERFFGNENPVGKQLIAEKQPYVVKGVFERNDRFHLQFNYIIPLSAAQLPPERMKSWGWQQFYSYARLKPGTNLASLEKKYQRTVAERSAPFTRDDDSKNVPFLQPIKDIHLYAAAFKFDMANRGNITYVKALGIIAAFILLIACFNFVNLATAKSMQRAREVGVRKTIGANRRHLLFQFVAETVFLTVISTLIATFLTMLLLPWLNEFTGKHISLLVFVHPLVVGGLLLLSILLGVIAGFYPALVMSGFKPIKVLKSSANGNEQAGKTPWLRHGLVVVQFSLSVLLIISALVVFKQVDYLHNKDLGFNKEEIMFFPMRGDSMFKKYDAFKYDLQQLPGVSSVSIGYGFPGDAVAGDDIIVPRNGEQKSESATQLMVDYDYIKTLGLQVVAGRDFSKDMSTDKDHAFIINETAVKQLGFGTSQKALGQTLSWKIWNDTNPDSLKVGKVIGVVKDFNYKSLYDKVEVAVLQIFPDAYWKVAVKMKTAEIGNTVDRVKTVWTKFTPDYPLEFKFLDANFDRMYHAEDKLRTLLWIFTFIAIFIGCLGLFGLAAYTAERRKKEVGIRKVLGASVQGVVVLLSKDFIKLVLVALLIASPIAWYFMQHWLQDFAYRINIEWWIFLIAGLTALSIAFITVSFQAIRAAIANPVKSLRTE